MISRHLRILGATGALALVAPVHANCLGKINEHPALEIKVGVRDGASGAWKVAAISWARTDGRTVYTTGVRKKDPKMSAVSVKASPETVPVVDIFNAAVAAEQSMPVLDHKAAKEGGEATVTLMLDGGGTHAAWRIDGAGNPKAGASCKKLLDLVLPLLTDEQKAEVEGPEQPMAWSGDASSEGWQVQFSLLEPYKTVSSISREIGFTDVLLQGRQAVIISGDSQILLDPKDGEPAPPSDDAPITAQENPTKLPDAPLATAMAAFQKAVVIEAAPATPHHDPQAWFHVAAGKQRYALTLDVTPSGKNKRAVDDLYSAFKKLLSPAEVKQLERKY